MPPASRAFLRESGLLLGRYLERIQLAVGKLDEEQLWWRPAEGTNSVGNLLLHLRGNLTQWVVSGIGGAPDGRRRSLEFSATGGGTAQELLAGLTEAVDRCRELAAGLDDAELERVRSIQGYDVTGLVALYHAVEHMSYHTGQIVYVAKQLLGPGSGIDFYPRHRAE
jgi:uncharacterized damage-inducible protein DinB